MRTEQPRRRGFSTGIAITALLVGTASGASAEDAEDGSLVTCSVDDDAALLGETVTCVATGLEPEKDFEWELDYYGLDLAIGEVDDWDELSEEQLRDFLGASLRTDGDVELADSEGVGSFGFVVPADLPIEFLGVFEGLVTQGVEYEQDFGGFIVRDFELSDLVCLPEPALPGARVACGADDQAEGEFEWFVELLYLDDLAPFEDALADEDAEDLLGADLDGLLAELEALGEFGLEEDGKAPFAEGEGDVGDDGVLTYDFNLPADTTALAYLTVFTSDSSLGVYVGEIGEPVEESAPVVAPVENDPAPAPVTVPRPTRVDTGAGGTADGGAGAAGGLLLATGLAALLGAGLMWRRRSVV